MKRITLFGRRPRDLDAADRAFRLQAYAWGMAGGVMAAIAGRLLFERWELSPLLGGVLGFAAGTLATGGLACRLAGASGSLAAALYHPSGRSTPGAREYSLADALAARGRFFDAAAELERCAGAYPGDVEPKVRLARLYRDALQQPEDAVAWFRRALDTPGLGPAAEQAVLRELIEVYTHRLRRPRAAMPWLARLAAGHGETAHGAWAKRELMELKRTMSEP